MKKKDKIYIESLKAYIETANSKVKYSLERFDILVISLSSGGLALSISLYEKFGNYDKLLVNIAWAFFSSALIINLLSQITGYWANKFDIKCTKILIEEIKGNEPENAHKKTDKYKAFFHFFTSLFNGLAFVCLTVAIILIILFVNLNNNNMSDKDKNQSGNNKEQSTPKPSIHIEKGNGSSHERLERSERTERSQTTREEWNKIDKKGQGAGDRPKRD